LNENKYKPNILVICGRNKRRSRTAEFIYKNDSRINIRSAGLSPQSNHKVNEKDLQWSDIILVMENEHQKKLKSLFRNFGFPKIVTLQIPDDYEYMDEELIEILTKKIEEIIE